MPRSANVRRVGADFNFCGYDPHGKKAHIVAHLYGPGYCGPEYPAHRIAPRFSGKSQAPPRYGAPNLDQIPWLPVGFVPRPPPLYFGKPYGPYLPSPLHFDPGIVAALVSRPRQYHTEELGLPEGCNVVNEVKDGVWLVTVFYTPSRGLERREFSILTDIAWDAFLHLASTYLGGRTTQLCCRMIGEGIQGCLFALRGGHDWAELMAGAQQHCAAGRYKEFQIIARQVELGISPSFDQRQIRALQLSQYPGLSSHLMDMERYPFDYPTVQELLQQLDATRTGDHGPTYTSYLETLYASWMIHVDDFTMISERDLFLWTGIPPGKIRAVYVRAQGMMSDVYVDNKGTIQEMAGLKREWCKGQKGTSVITAKIGGY